MGREIRKVPPNWEHPREEDRPHHFQPMYDRTFDKAAVEYRDGFTAWYAGTDPDRDKYKNDKYKNDDGTYLEYWEWAGSPPDRQYYRPWKDEEATWYQVFETVSEGTPVTPPFATKEELARYLVQNGDFWDQKRGDGPWSEASAKAFCDIGWTMSFAVLNGAYIDGRDVPAAMADNKQ